MLKLRIVILVLLNLFIQQAFSANAVLLTSLKLSDGMLKKIEKQFKKSFGDSDLTPIIHHNVGPRLLFNVLSSEENSVVIWISHAAAEHSLKMGISAKNIILDVYGNDVKKFFTSPHRGLRFLGIVGCEAQTIIDGFKAKGLYDNLPNLEIMSFNKKVRLFRGLKAVLKRSNVVLSENPGIHEVNTSKTIEFVANREASSASGWLELGDRILGYFEPSVDAISKTLRYESHLWTSLSNRNIKFFRDLENDNNSDLGKVTFSSNYIFGSWKGFTNSAGRFLGGKNQQLYIYEP